MPAMRNGTAMMRPIVKAFGTHQSLWRALADIASDELTYASFAAAKSALKSRTAERMEKSAAIQRMISPATQT